MPVEDMTADPHAKKTDGILEQLGLHPAQLQAQQQLTGMWAQMATNRPPKELTPDPVSEESIEAGQGPQFSSWAKQYLPTEEPKAEDLVSLPGPNYGTSNPFKGEGSGFLKPPTTLVGNQEPEPAPTEEVSSLPGPNPRGQLITQKASAQASGAQDELDRLQSTGSGISQIKNPFLRTLATVGDTVGKAMFPSIEAGIPGTQGHHDELINTELRRLGANEEVMKKQAEADYKTAQAAKEQTQPEKDEWSLNSEFQGPNGEPIEINKRTGQTRFAAPGEGTHPIDKTRMLESNQPLRNLDQLNGALTKRYQVLHPGEPLPTEFILGDGATQRDFSNIDKLMEASEKASATKEQNETLNELRRQTLAIAAGAQKGREEKTGRELVIGQDENGNLVAVPESDSDKYNLTDVIKPGAPQVEKILNARNLLPLFNNKDPQDPGLIQMVEVLDRQGKLGPLASRWNEFLAGTWGSGDPQYVSFRAKMGLANTALMNVHVGNRGGSYLLEHFENLASGEKMDGASLRSGLSTEFHYITHRAMMPGQKTVNSNAVPHPEAQRPEAAPPAKPPAGGKSITKARAEQLALDNDLTYEEVVKDAQKHGVSVR